MTRSSITTARAGDAAVRTGIGASSLPIAALAAALALSYVVLIAWPMRIWYRPVSPHTHLVGTLGISRAGAATYVLTVLLLFALYAAALFLVLTRRVRPSPALVLGASALFSLVLWATHPLTSTDIFNYIAGARLLWVHGENPLTTPPLAHPEDWSFGLLTFWQNIPSPYGPLWSLLAAVPVALGGDSPLRTVLAFKALVIGAFLATSLLVYITARRIRPDSAVPAVLAFSWNPLAVLHVAGNGHNDVLMMLCVLIFLYALTRGWVAAALVALAASALVKYASLLVAPVFLVWWLRSRQRAPLRDLLIGSLGGVLLAVAVYAPFWDGRETVSTALDEGSYYTVSVPAAIRGALLQVTSASRAEQVTMLLTRGLFLAALAWILLRLRGDRVGRLAEAGFLAFFAYLTLAASYFSPWHVLWPLSFAVLLPFRRDVLWPAITLSLTAMSVLVAAVWFRERFAPDPRGDWYGMHLAAALAVFPLPVLVWLWTVRYPAGTPVRRAALRRAAASQTGSRPRARPAAARED